MIEVLFAPVNANAIMPEQAYEYDAGWDVFAAQSRLLLHGEIAIIPLGFKMAVPPGYEAQIRPRSSIGGMGIIIPNSPGTIDSGYRREVMVLLQNTGLTKYQVNVGDKIAQMVTQKVPMVQLRRVQESDLPVAERGNRGFGSSGKRWWGLNPDKAHKNEDTAKL